MDRIFFEGERTRVLFNYEYDQTRAKKLACEDWAFLDAYYARRGARFPDRGVIVEFGSGLTGGSDWLTAMGPLTITDIIAPPLVAASERLRTNRTNTNVPVSLTLLRNHGDIESLPKCDLLYSAMLAKSVPPTVLAHVLGLLLSKVATNGVALLHAPTEHRLYQQDVNGRPEILGDLYAIPQWKLFEMLELHEFSVVLVQENPILRGSDIVYHTIFAQRRGSFGSIEAFSSNCLDRRAHREWTFSVT